VEDIGLERRAARREASLVTIDSGSGLDLDSRDLSPDRAGAQVQFLLRVKEYAQYLYEAEDRRAERFQEATKTYLLFIGSTLAGTVGTLKWLDLRPTSLLSRAYSAKEQVVLIALLIAVLALGASFLMTILVVKVRQREGLCEPRQFLAGAALDNSETEALERIIADFVVAAERNVMLNDEKARLLASASRIYRVALATLTLAAVGYVLL